MEILYGGCRRVCICCRLLHPCERFAKMRAYGQIIGRDEPLAPAKTPTPHAGTASARIARFTALVVVAIAAAAIGVAVRSARASGIILIRRGALVDIRARIG